MIMICVKNKEEYTNDMDEYNDIVRDNVAGFEVREDDESWDESEVNEVNEMAQLLQQEITEENSQ